MLIVKIINTFTFEDTETWLSRTNGANVRIEIILKGTKVLAFDETPNQPSLRVIMC